MQADWSRQLHALFAFGSCTSFPRDQGRRQQVEKKEKRTAGGMNVSEYLFRTFEAWRVSDGSTASLLFFPLHAHTCLCVPKIICVVQIVLFFLLLLFKLEVNLPLDRSILHFHAA